MAGISKVGPEDLDIVLKFGGGLHTRASEDEIDPREAADGQNFQLDLEDRQLRPRKGFDLVGTAPNAGSILGGFSLLKADGTVHFGIQAGDTVYEWDGSSTFTQIGSVSSSARLRGHWRTHQWTLNDRVLITDLALVEVVKEWDGGSTFADVAFLSDPSTSFGSFYAKYMAVVNERAIFGHIRDGSGTYEHLVVGSAREDYTTLTVSNRASSSLNAEDPWYLPIPDLKPINVVMPAFGALLFSTEKGVLWDLQGVDASDFALDQFYPGSAVSGDEAIAYAGRDIVYGRQGRMESLVDTDRFGDSEANDITRPVADKIEAYTGWTLIRNDRLDRVYAFPSGVSECWVLQNALRGRSEPGGGEFSPWMKWTTLHDMAFQPTFAMSMLDPSDGLEYVFLGYSDGTLYRLEGTGASDGGTEDIAVEFLSKLFSADLNAQAFDVEGYIKYRKNVAATVELVFEYAGTSIFNQSVTVDIPAISDRPVWGGGFYWGGFHWGSITGKLSRQPYTTAGQGNEFQIRVKVQGQADFTINEIGVRLRAASS